MDKKRAIGVAAYETQQLAERLKKAATADDYDVIGYGELTKLIGFDVRKDGRGYLSAARRIAERDTGRLFGCVAKEGIKLLAPGEQVATGVDSVSRVRRLTRKAINRVGLVQVDKLDDAQKSTYHTTASVLGAIHLFSTPKSVAKIETAVAKSADKLPLGDTLKLFGG